MVDILTMPGIDTQPKFPWEDLSPSNLDWFAVRLANGPLVYTRHLDSEAAILGFRSLHPAVVPSAEHAFAEGLLPEAVDHGAACIETIHLLVMSLQAPDHNRSRHNSSSLLARLGHQSVRSYIHNALDRFRACMPNTTTAVHEAATVHFGDKAESSVLGAALMWQVVCDSSNRPIEKFDEDEADALLRSQDGV